MGMTRMVMARMAVTCVGMTRVGLTRMGMSRVGMRVVSLVLTRMLPVESLVMRLMGVAFRRVGCAWAIGMRVGVAVMVRGGVLVRATGGSGCRARDRCPLRSRRSLIGRACLRLRPAHATPPRPEDPTDEHTSPVCEAHVTSLREEMSVSGFQACRKNQSSRSVSRMAIWKL